MQALILAGGRGTRLRPLTVYTPKPVVPVMNRPFLLYQLDNLRKAGIEDIVLSLSYQPDKIEHVLREAAEESGRIKIVTEPTPLGTAGGYRFAVGNATGTTVVLNGDILTNADLARLVQFHRDNKAEATIALAPVEDPAAYGLVETGKDCRVKRFLEKPDANELAKLKINTVNAGIYVLEPSVLELIPKGENRSFEYHVFPELLKTGRDFFAFKLDREYWRDLGTPESYLAAHLDLLNSVDGLEPNRGSECEIATAALVDERSVIGAGCVIKPSVQIINSVLGPGVNVDEKTIVENSVIWAHTRIASNAEVRGSVIGRGCHIGRNAQVCEGTVLGDKASIPDYSRI